MTTETRGLALLLIVSVLLVVSVCMAHAQRPAAPRVASSSGQIQLTPNSRLYWYEGAVDPQHPKADSYEITVDGTQPVDVGPCLQTPESVDPSYPCDAAIPAAAFQPGMHTIALRAKATTGVSAWSPSPPIDALGIANVPLAGAPSPPAVGPVILFEPPPLQLTTPPSLTMTAVSASGVTVTYAPPTPSGGKSPYQVSCTPGSGSTFPVGITTVNCTCVDALSTQATTNFSVTVSYTPPPPSSTPWQSVGTAPVGTTTTRDALVLSPLEWLITTRRNGVQHTTDGGQTFTALNVGLGTGQTAADTQMLVRTGGSGTVFLSAQCSVPTCTLKTGVFSLDAAHAGWAQTGMTQPVGGLAVSPTTDELLAVAYVTATSSWDVFHSTDDAKTWTNVSHKIGPGTPVQFACGPDGQCWIATSNDGVWASAGADYSGWKKVSTVNGATGFGFFGPSAVVLFTATDLRLYDTNAQTFKVIAASGWIAQDVGQSSYATSSGFYLGTNHVTNGVYHSSDLALFSPFQEGSWNSLANSGVGVRVYVMRATGKGNEVIAVLRDGRIYAAGLP